MREQATGPVASASRPAQGRRVPTSATRSSEAEAGRYGDAVVVDDGAIAGDNTDVVGVRRAGRRPDRNSSPERVPRSGGRGSGTRRRVGPRARTATCDRGESTRAKAESSSTA